MIIIIYAYSHIFSLFHRNICMNHGIGTPKIVLEGREENSIPVAFGRIHPLHNMIKANRITMRNVATEVQLMPIIPQQPQIKPQHQCQNNNVHGKRTTQEAPKIGQSDRGNNGIFWTAKFTFRFYH
jgi:hypothetical protein